MLPWPVIAVGLGRLSGQFEQWFEVAIMFGSITIFFLLPFALFGVEIPEIVICGILLAVWCGFLLFPLLASYRWRTSRQVLIVLYILQSAFSAAQAALGLLMLIGKSV